MASPFRKSLTLATTGNAIPILGLGVFQIPPGEDTFNAVLSALRAGYRHIDTASLYKNEADVGRALHHSNIPRDEVFITSKLWLSSWGYSNAVKGIEQSLKNLDTGYIDLYLLHAPGDPLLRGETWKALEVYHEKGALKNIGVSNFSEKHLEKLFTTAKIKPSVNQIEIHPFLQRRNLVEYCNNNNILVEAYSPLARGRKLLDVTIATIAVKHHITPAQVFIAWSVSKGFVALPKSVKPERQRENLAAADILLSDEEIAQLDELDAGLVTGWDPVKNDPV